VEFRLTYVISPQVEFRLTYVTSSQVEFRLTYVTPPQVEFRLTYVTNHYVIKFVRDSQQVSDFYQVLWIPEVLLTEETSLPRENHGLA
jgi:hypothetical protein